MIRAVLTMNHYTRLAVAVICTVLGSVCCELDFCEDGYQIAKKYSDCWTQSSFANKQFDLSEPRDVYTKEFVEAYARHMCSVVKPEAIKCLKEEMAHCQNIQKIVEMADESGGTCDHNNLNVFFKLHIIDYLAPVRKDSPCFTIADNSSCYNAAAMKVKTKGVPISRFHYEAEKFFADIWECQVKLFKSKSEICRNWQLPMLLSLQRMAMPSLFGMKLTDEHVEMLELGKVVPTSRPIPGPQICDNDNKNQVYILLKVLKQRPEPADGDVVLQISIGDSQRDDGNIKQINAPENKKRKQNKGQKNRKEKTGRKDIDSSDSEMIN